MKKFPLVCAIFCAAATLARAVILLDTANPTANTTAPIGTLANSGWQFQGTWGGFLGTPIAPHFFISAAHIGQAGGTFSYQGSTYTIVRWYGLTNSDLIIWQVNETFPNYAPIYTKSDEAGKHLVVIGRGTQRGADIVLNTRLRGWSWGGDDHVQRWGENDVTGIVPYFGHDLVYATFDQGGHPNESHLSAGDSGGAMFIDDGGIWKLAGINYSVDDLFTTPADSSAFTAAVFDSRDYYTKNSQNNFVLISGPDPVPTGFYSSRISSERAWIYSVIDPNADPDGDGISNFLEFAFHLDPLAPDVSGLPRVGREGNFLTITYQREVGSNGLVYTLQKSTDLLLWQDVDTTETEEVLGTSGNLQTIEVKVDAGAATKLFARLRISRP